jgi:hypothetical protein
LTFACLYISDTFRELFYRETNIISTPANISANQKKDTLFLLAEKNCEIHGNSDWLKFYNTKNPLLFDVSII